MRTASDILFKTLADPQNASAFDAMSDGWRQMVERLEQVSAHR